MRVSLKEETTSENKTLLLELQRELLKILKPETNKNVREQEKNTTENELREFYTPTRPVMINTTLNDDTNISRNLVTRVLNDSTNQPKRAKTRSQSQPASKEPQ